MSSTAEKTIVIGTRGSALARWQANHVAQLLRALDGQLVIQEKIIITTGDRFQGAASGAGAPAGSGKEVWVKEIEEALLAGEIHLAVHSLKDVPADLPAGLVIGAIPPRADARDALVSGRAGGLDGLPPGSRVGTSSVRRMAQLQRLRPDLRTEILRGNVDTRLRKVSEGVVDAALLACAGLDRLGWSDRISERISTDRMLPAVGQGALAIEIREKDSRVMALCRGLADGQAERQIAAERALLHALGGSCRTPLAGHAVVDGQQLRLHGWVSSPDGHQVIAESAEATLATPTPEALAQAALLGRQLADRMRQAGADRLLAINS